MLTDDEAARARHPIRRVMIAIIIIILRALLPACADGRTDAARVGRSRTWTASRSSRRRCASCWTSTWYVRAGSRGARPDRRWQHQRQLLLLQHSSRAPGATTARAFVRMLMRTAADFTRLASLACRRRCTAAARRRRRRTPPAATRPASSSRCSVMRVAQAPAAAAALRMLACSFACVLAAWPVAARQLSAARCVFGTWGVGVCRWLCASSACSCSWRGCLCLVEPDVTLEVCEQGHVEKPCFFVLVEDLVDSCSIVECEKVWKWLEGASSSSLPPPAAALRSCFARARGDGRRGGGARARRQDAGVGAAGVLQQGQVRGAAHVQRAAAAAVEEQPHRLLRPRAHLPGAPENVTKVEDAGEGAPHDHPHAVPLRAALRCVALRCRGVRTLLLTAAAAVRAGEESLDAADSVDDAKFHRSFWSLQQYFSSPPLVTSSDDKWSEFVATSELSLSAFESHTLNLSRPKVAGADDDDGVAAAGKRAAAQRTYAIKYLTSRRLIRLQLRDVDFRRTILVQFLILLGYLRCAHATSKASRMHPMLWHKHAPLLDGLCAQLSARSCAETRPRRRTAWQRSARSRYSGVCVPCVVRCRRLSALSYAPPVGAR
eukprot:scaffold585_cov311-Prasinococcus_capsulatus_cf.AAC.3